MIYGISPVIGPSWENFAWAGREIFQQGLAISASDWKTVAAELIRQLQQPAAMQGQQAAAVKYLEAQKGGAARAVRRITDILKTPHSSGEISYDITA